MLKIYARAEVERELLPILAEFRCRVYSSRKIPRITRKVRGSEMHKVVHYPLS